MDVFDLSARISLDSSEYEKGLNSAEKQSSGLASKIGGGLKTAAKVGATAIGVASTAIGALTKKSIDNYAEYEQLVGGVETLFKKSAGQVQKYADQAYKTAGMSANEYMSTVTSFSASLLQGLGGDTKKAADYANKAVVDMSDNANKMGTDMGMIQNAYQGFAKQNYTMLDNLKLGYGGTAAEMARLVKDSGVLGDAGKDLTAKNLNEKVSFDQIVEAIHKTQERMGIAGTTSKEAASTIEGSISSMKSAWQNLVTGIARSDSDLSGLIGQFIDSLKTVWDNVRPVMYQALTGIGQLISEMLPEILNEVPGIISKVLPKLVTQGIAMLNSLIDGLVEGLPKLSETAFSIFDTLISKISSQTPELITTITSIVLDLAQSLIDNAPLLLESAMTMIQAIAEGLGNAVPIILEKLPILINSLITWILQSIPLIVETGVQLLVGLIQGLPQAITQILSALPMLIDSIISGLLTALPLIVDAGIQLLTALTQNMPVIIDSIVNSLPAIIDSIVSGLLGALPQIVDAGIMLFMALLQSMPQILIAVGKATPRIIKTLIVSLTKAIPQVVAAGKKILTSIFQAIPQALTYIGKSLGDVKDAIIDAFKDFDLIETGKNLIEGLWNGISDMAGWIKEKLESFGDGVVKTVKKIFGVESPSKVFAEIGGFLAEGLGKGWEEEYPDVNRTITQGLDFSGQTANISVQEERQQKFIANEIRNATNGIINAIIENGETSIVLNSRELGRAVRSYV